MARGGERLSNITVLAYSYSGPYYYKVAGVELANGVSIYREDFNGPSVYTTLWEGEFVTISGKVVDENMNPLDGATILIQNFNNLNNSYYFRRTVAANGDGSFRFHVAWNNIDEAGHSPLSGRARIRIVAKTRDGKAGVNEVLLENPRILTGGTSEDDPTWNTVECNAIVIAR